MSTSPPSSSRNAESFSGFNGTPTDVKFASIKAGSGYFIGIDAEGDLQGWGAVEPEYAPTLVPSFPDVTALDIDDFGVGAVNASAATYWGSHFQVPLLEVPSYILDAAEDVVELELSYQNGFALMSNGDVLPMGNLQ